MKASIVDMVRILLSKVQFFCRAGIASRSSCRVRFPSVRYCHVMLAAIHDMQSVLVACGVWNLPCKLRLLSCKGRSLSCNTRFVLALSRTLDKRLKATLPTGSHQCRSLGSCKQHIESSLLLLSH